MDLPTSGGQPCESRASGTRGHDLQFILAQFRGSPRGFNVTVFPPGGAQSENGPLPGPRCAGIVRVPWGRCPDAHSADALPLGVRGPRSLPGSGHRPSAFCPLCVPRLPRAPTSNSVSRLSPLDPPQRQRDRRGVPTIRRHRGLFNYRCSNSHLCPPSTILAPDGYSRLGCLRFGETAGRSLAELSALLGSPGSVLLCR
ncbi:hypothetical protein NDU88_009592 [Pleurodeles waltl]|uniref:Uncharacterized protein n=1 Tax=Pleurodeles waltl TaxID=8319 RepID=A0AAV7QV13_PLEWA|nr:hypothetical protein NDU88_009592 [Pleurodeles waltl]